MWHSHHSSGFPKFAHRRVISRKSLLVWRLLGKAPGLDECAPRAIVRESVFGAETSCLPSYSKCRFWLTPKLVEHG